MMDAGSYRGLLWAIAALALAVPSLGCGRSLGATTTQVNPLRLAGGEVLRESRHLHIDVKDMEIPRTFKLRNSAYFAVVSRDRLRFHVSLVHKWEEMTDVRGWEVRLVDDQGRTYYPEAKEKRRRWFRTYMWDYEQHTPRVNGFGDTVGTWNDGHRHRTQLASVDVFQGEGDYVFHAIDLLGPKVERLTLIMRRSGIEYRFTWNFVNPV